MERVPDPQPADPPLPQGEQDPEHDRDRDLTDLEALERELAALEHELDIVDGTPGDE